LIVSSFTENGPVDSRFMLFLGGLFLIKKAREPLAGSFGKLSFFSEKLSSKSDISGGLFELISVYFKIEKNNKIRYLIQ
jgi:hypothetical protein